MKIEQIQGYSKIYQAETFPDDVVAMFKGNKGDMPRYMNWLAAMLEVLDTEGVDALTKNHFEYIRGTEYPRIYAIRHEHSKINERYLYVYEDNEKTILLTAFKEKSSSDYARSIVRAINIYSELELENTTE